MILENINYFQEVVNPLYAFPVVGVVLCALLVFAFGFKTPAQPPSFDFVEHRKGATKKKTKSKEIKTSKPVQNGNAHSSEPNSNSSAAAAKTQNNKAAKNSEAAPVKKSPSSESKSSKAKKADISTSSAPVTKADIIDEAAENLAGSGEWTQKLSRKDRKNRKGKEVSVNLKNTINLLTVSSKENSPVESTKEIKSLVHESIEDKENIETKEIPNIADETAPSKTEATPEEAPVKKSKQKKKDLSDLPTPTVEPAENKDVATKGTKESSKKAKKAAKESAKAVEKVVSVEEKQVAAEMQLETPPEKEPEQEVPAEVSPSQAAEKEQSTDLPSAEESSAKSTSNVVFDELGDLWHDAKPQKKKKKARRE